MCLIALPPVRSGIAINNLSAKDDLRRPYLSSPEPEYHICQPPGFGWSEPIGADVVVNDNTDRNTERDDDAKTLIECAAPSNLGEFLSENQADADEARKQLA